MAHWINDNADESDLVEIVRNTGWSLSISDNDRGPIELNHDDGSEISLVRSTNTGTFAVEYEPGSGATAGVNLNKRDTYHHESWPNASDAVEWVGNIVEMHEKKN